MIPDEKEGEEYCKCVIEKVTNEPELKSKYQKQLENDEINDVFKEVKASSQFLELGIEECMQSVTIKWTDNIANSMKNTLEKELVGTEFEETNDIVKYCDCLVKKYRQFPLNNIMEEGFTESQQSLGIEEKCTAESKK